MQEEAAQTLSIISTSDAPQITAGHKFTLDRHFDANGDYLITRVSHTASLGLSFRAGDAPYRTATSSVACLWNFRIDLSD